MTNSKIEIGYTLTDCYRGNANFKGQQKQYVLKVGEELQNILIGGFVNCPSDTGRERSYFKLSEISESEYLTLKAIAKSYQPINWNTGRYTIYDFGKVLSKKEAKELKEAENHYMRTMMRICEPKNDLLKKQVVRKIKAILKPYLSKADYKYCHQFIYTF